MSERQPGLAQAALQYLQHNIRSFGHVDSSEPSGIVVQGDHTRVEAFTEGDIAQLLRDLGLIVVLSGSANIDDETAHVEISNK